MIVVPIVLPLSLCYNIYTHIRNSYTFYMKSSPLRHSAKVKRVSQEMAANSNEKVLALFVSNLILKDVYWPPRL